MSLRRLVLAACCSLPSVSQADSPKTEQSEQPKPEKPPPRGSASPAFDQLSLDLSGKYGYTWRKGFLFEEMGASIGLERILFGLQLRQESSPREKPDTLTIAGVEVEGTRSYRLFQVNFLFGYAFYHLQRSWLEAKVYADVLGGIQLDKSEFTAESSTIPGSPTLDFLLGAGARLEATYKLSHLTNLRFLRNLELGLGVAADYLSERVVRKDPERGIYLGGYVVGRMGNRR